jgi:hypothetical protein
MVLGQSQYREFVCGKPAELVGHRGLGPLLSGAHGTTLSEKVYWCYAADMQASTSWPGPV